MNKIINNLVIKIVYNSHIYQYKKCDIYGLFIYRKKI